MGELGKIISRVTMAMTAFTVEMVTIVLQVVPAMIRFLEIVGMTVFLVKMVVIILPVAPVEIRSWVALAMTIFPGGAIAIP
jgi:hypothetical protein